MNNNNNNNLFIYSALFNMLGDQNHMFVSVALKTLLKGIFLAWVTGILDVQCITFQAPVVQKLDSAIYRINLSAVDNSG